MKLRNKKTGEIVTIGQEPGDDFDGVGLMLWFNHVEGSELDDHKIYDSLAKLNEEWEDYNPKEPLIKDEKIRKAVRAWAAANGFQFIWHEFHTKRHSIIGNGVMRIWLPKLELEDSKNYTIEELCGEEDGN